MTSKEKKEESEDVGLFSPDLLSQNELCFAIKPKCMRHQGASQLIPDLNNQRIRCDFSPSLSCKTKGGHKVCKPDPKAE